MRRASDPYQIYRPANPEEVLNRVSGRRPHEHNAARSERDGLTKKFGEKNLDVLQNIEFGIIEVYRADPSLLDIDAKDAIDAIARHYHAEEAQHTPPTVNLGERAQRVFLSVQKMCEWRLGRSSFPGEADEMVSGIPVSELVKCLRQIQKSIPRWSRQGGRKGYLDFVSQYLP